MKKKKTLEQIEKLLERVKKETKMREKIFNKHSDKWQESDKGQKFLEKKILLGDVEDRLESARDAMVIFIN